MPRPLLRLLLSFLFLGFAAVSFAQAAEDEPCDDCQETQTAGTTFVAELEKIQSDTMKRVLEVAESVPEDKLDWRPAEGSPSAADLLAKIAQHNFRTARFLRQQDRMAEATGKAQLAEQIRLGFAAFSRGLGSLPAGKTPADLQVDTSTMKSTMREFLMRHMAWNSQLLGQLEMVAQRIAG